MYRPYGVVGENNSESSPQRRQSNLSRTRTNIALLGAWPVLRFARCTMFLRSNCCFLDFFIAQDSSAATFDHRAISVV